MITTILTVLAPVLVKGFEILLDKIGASKEARKKFLELTAELGKQGLITTQLAESYEQQLKRIEESQNQQELHG